MKFFFRSMANYLVKPVFVAVIGIYLILPVLLLYFTSIHNAVIFSHFMKVPFQDYSNLNSFGVESFGRNVRIKTDTEYIGAWHVVPKELEPLVNTEADFDTVLTQSGHPVIVYLHGNAFTRAQRHRVQLMNVLSRGGYHVVAIDYRGFADSTGSPTEKGVVNDSKAAYEWVRKRTGPGTPVFLWGHSLGSAIGTSAAKELCESGHCPSGLILDAAFSNFSAVVRDVKHSAIYRNFPWRDQILIDPCRKYLKIDMNSDENISKVKVPILLLHAQDDDMVPVWQARDLYQAAKRHGCRVQLTEFKGHYGYCHNDMWKAPNLIDILNGFISRVKRDDFSENRRAGHVVI